MTETPAGAMPGGPMSDRMQALLSAAAEEQVREQRAVSTVLGELRGQVAGLTEGVRSAASDATVERLGGVVSTVVADLRTSTSLLGQRIESLSKRIDAIAADTAAPTEQAAVRLAALSADVTAQGETVERMSAALDQLAGFPGALAALQKDVAGLHDRLAPLAEVRSGLSDLGARTAHSLEQLRPQVDAVRAKLDAIGTVPDAERLRDAVVDALGPRLDKLEAAAARPVVGPEALKGHFGDLRAALGSQTGDRFDEVQAALGAIENRLGQVGERLADVGDAAGGVPAVSAELARLHTRLDELAAIREQLTKVGQDVSALQDESGETSLAGAIAALRDDVGHLDERLGAQAPPAGEEIATVVSQRVSDRLVETLAPRIADVVLTRVSAALVTQLGEALSPRVKADTEEIVRAATAESERRVLAHVDEAVLALAEALLRRRRGGRTPEIALQDLGGAIEEPAAAPAGPAEVEQTAAPAAPAVAHSQEPIEAVLDRLSAVPEPAPEAAAEAPDVHDRPAVTTSLAPPSPNAPAPVRTTEPPAQAQPPTAAEPAQPEATEQPEKVAKAPAKAAAKAPAKAPPKAASKAPAKGLQKKAQAPVKKATRPPTRQPSKPILERTPDVPDDDREPLRPAAPAPAERPVTPPPATSRPAVPSPPPTLPGSLPQSPAPAPEPTKQQEPRKRKPWWRPGG
ncbi:MAG: hypothetical protein JWO27_245 [Frankiales bacterium]|nr:hypothetical protein [Frankiales bacterium]